MVDQFPRIRPVQREPVASEVARVLLDYIFSGKVGPGSKMPSERQLAEAFGTGRSAVREALKALALLGLVDFRQGSGTYLRTPDSELLPRVIEWGLLLGERRVIDLVEARRPLELAVAEFAAQRRTATDVRALKRQLVAMQRARTADAFVEADVAFHLKIAEASRNSVLSSMLTSIQSLQRVWVKRVIKSVGSWDVQATQHVPIFEAIEQQNVSAARTAMHAHMEGAVSRLMSTLEAYSKEDASSPEGSAVAALG